MTTHPEEGERAAAQTAAARLSRFAPVYRVAGILGIALLALVIPEFGPNRYLLAGLLLLVCTPVGWWLSRTLSSEADAWAEPLFDLLLVVGFVHLVPAVWLPALCVGVMVALAPSVGLHPRSFRIYSGYALILILGMGFAAWLHEVPDSLLPLVAIAAIYPSLLFYAYVQARRAEELRRRSQLVESLAQVAGGVAHDFNNMLMGIMGHSELALMDLPEDLPAAKSLREIIIGAKRASLLSRQLLSFSGRDVGAEGELELNSELDMIVRLIRPLLPDGVRLAHSKPQEQLFVRMDKSQMHQIILNAVLNAAASPDGRLPRIELRLRRIVRQGQNWASLTISEPVAGRGLAAARRWSNPFVASEHQRHRFGLTGGRKALRAVGGSIELKQVEGIGFTVCLLLPLLRVVRPDADTALNTDRWCGRILVVDDEVQVQDVLYAFLDRLGIDAVVAGDCEEAVRAFAQAGGDFDTVLLDLKMPGKDGWQCLEELRAIRSDVPVIICSGYNPEARAADVGRVENVRFLNKPFGFEEL
ncbi:MAG: response regulator, partial [Pseudomonadales bacterium]|nr:response regulator [Pseudomonadales bacterium]